MIRIAPAIAAAAALVVSPAAAAAKPAAKLPAKASPKPADWTRIVSATAEGGFRMGNPNARVKLVEYGSLTCPHCKKFDDEGAPALVGKYVKSGQVSWEFRNYVRDPFDLTASLIARCNGAKSFFPLMRALYNDQPAWVGRVQGTSLAELERLQKLPPSQQFVGAAKVAGLQQWAAARGVPAAKSNQCLSNEKSVEQLVQRTRDAMVQYPDFQGTPTFVINGSLVKGVASWDQLEPQLKQALGG